ncbi:hypothetical protein [Paenibacillus sp. Y412MC10]|uniref:hypothetical protein n=1 Tax=Geobacillus sp. (strain Y412MC10) TaxID=481743 RepID=UPI0011AB6528|nr:hypothetical protein [Paenibacillus sp. Y412MC10]
MARATWVNTAYKSIYDGLDDLQSHFLSQELMKNHSRPTKILRTIAKVRAFKQRVKWILQEATIVFGIFLVATFGAVALIVAYM